MAETITELGDVKAVGALLVIHPKSVYRIASNDPTFPRGIKITAGCTRWDMNAVRAWIASRAEASQ